MIQHLLCYQRLAVDDYGLTSAELSRCPPLMSRIWGTLDFRSFEVVVKYDVGTGHYWFMERYMAYEFREKAGLQEYFSKSHDLVRRSVREFVKKEILPFIEDWEEQGVWLTLWRKFLSELDEQSQLDWEETFADGSFASAKKGGPASARPNAERVRSGWWWSMARESLSVLISIRPRRVR